MSAVAKWILVSVIALCFTAAGLCICIDAGLLKFAGKNWFVQGTLGLIVFNTGICLVAFASKLAPKK
jgi:hypothetical protein